MRLCILEALPFANDLREQRQEPSSAAFELNIQATSGFPTLVPSIALERQLDFRLLEAPQDDHAENREPESGKIVSQDQSVAIHIHCYYVEELAVILEALERCVEALAGRSALFLTTDTEEKRHQILDLIANSRIADKLPIKAMQLVENRGRNLRPLFLDIYPLIAGYDIALHLHAKRSVTNHFGREWLLDLLQSLIPSEDGVTSVLSTFSKHPRLGLIMPQAGDTIRQLSNWGSNFVLAKMVCSMAFPDRVLDPQAPLLFPAGMMFWFRPAALQQMADTCQRLIPFVTEPVAEDGTLLHALERLSAHFCEAAGYRWALASRNPEELATVSSSTPLPDISVWGKNEEAYLHATHQLAEAMRYVQQSLDELNRTCEQQEIKPRDHEQAWERERQELRRKLNRQQEANSDLEARAYQSSLELAEQVTLLKLQQQAFAELQARHKQTEQELHRMREANLRHSHTQNEIRDLLALLATRDQRIVSLENQREKSFRQCQKLSNRLSESRSEISRLRDQVKAECLERSALQTQLQNSFCHQIHSFISLLARKIMARHNASRQQAGQPGDHS